MRKRVRIFLLPVLALSFPVLAASPEKAELRKTPIVSCNQTGVYKALALPLVREPFRFGSGMKDPVWKKAARDNAFVRFSLSRANAVIRPSVLALFRTDRELVMGWFFTAPEAERSDPKDGGDKAVWSGDHAEIHFGALEPDPWYRQLVCGISGLKWDSEGAGERWEYVPFATETGWGGEVRLPLSCLRCTDGGVFFNFCRNSPKVGAMSCWAPMMQDFQEIENYGELLFGSYETVRALRTGSPAEGPLSRAGFEAEWRTWSRPAQTVTHGPFLSNPSDTSVSISWTTAGKVPAFLEYRKKYSPEKPTRVYCSMVNGLLCSENSHFAQLDGLAPDTEYEYAVFSLAPVTRKIAGPDGRGTFRTPSLTAPYTFFCVADLHDQARDAASFGGETGVPAFRILLGDSLSHVSGRESFYRGAIDPFVRRAPRVPLVFVRGNHEVRGPFAAEYYAAMRHGTGRTWYSFCYGNAFFLVLDTGEDHPDREDAPWFSNRKLEAEELLWLKNIVRCDAYRNAAFRIVLMHIPPLAAGTMPVRLMAPMLQEGIPAPDLVLSGHWHQYAFLPENRSGYSAGSHSLFRKKVPHPVMYPFPRMILAREMLLSAEVSHDALTVRTFRRKPNGSPEPGETFRFLPKHGSAISEKKGKEEK